MTIFKNKSFPLSPSRFLGALSITTIVPVLVMVIAVIARPLWRDEYWALYFSDIHHSLDFLLTERLHYDTHPPLYFIILHFWRLIANHVLWIKLFSLLCLILSGFGIWNLRSPKKTGAQMTPHVRFETILFFIMCLGSYWVIYFMAEIRPYIMLFSLCAFSVFYVQAFARKIQNKTKLTVFNFCLWAVLGMCISLSHYYGAVWVALCGAGLGIWAWCANQRVYFFAFAAATLVALLPVSLWILTSVATINFGETAATPTELFTTGAHQFLRSIFGKTLIANIGLSLIMVVGLPLWWQRKTPTDIILLLACIGLIVIVFFVHVFLQPFIKERAFLVIMPALIFIMARSIAHAVFEHKIGAILQKTALIFAVLTPLLFWSEFFKDREKITQVRDVFIQDPSCQLAPIATYFRPSPQGDDFSAFYINLALATLYDQSNLQPKFLDITKLDSQAKQDILNHPCSVKILTMNLRRGGIRSTKADHIAFRRAVVGFTATQSLSSQHIGTQNLAHIMIGKGRNQLYLLAPR